MEYSILTKEDARHVTFYGSLGPSARSQFLEIAEAMKTAAEKTWVLNIHEFDYIDSTGIGMLIELQEKAAPLGLSLTLVGAQPAVQKMFKLTNFDQMYNIAE